MGWEDAKFVDIERLHEIVQTYCKGLEELTYPDKDLSTTVAAHRLPLDLTATVCGALAFGALANGEYARGQSYFTISTELAKHFAGIPSQELCLAYFLQHVFALRTGTSNYAQSIMAQTIQIAHEIGIHQGMYGTPGLQLYLLIYMADQ